MANAYRSFVLMSVTAMAGCAGAAPDAGQPGQAHEVAPLALPLTTTCLAGEREDVAERLSETGCFESADPALPVAGMVPFSPNAPLWTDGADKTRWLSVPPGSQIEVDERGDFVFPVGTVLAKHFAVDGRLVETRLLMRHADGWTGYPYQWNGQGTDAVLVMNGARVEGVLADGSGWSIPSSATCDSCHNEETHVAMGLEIAQLNGPLDHPSTDRQDNQLELLQELGLLSPIDFPADVLPALVDYTDTEAPLEDRARAYLHANCSSCHTAPDNLCSGDLRWSADMAQMGVCDAEPKLELLEAPQDTKLLAPGHPERSAMWLRLKADPNSGTAMPPVGREHVDMAGAELIRRWIESLQDCD